MVKTRNILFLAGLELGLVLLPYSLSAAVITLKIRAINPGGEIRKVEVKKLLPAGVKPEDVVNAAEYQIAYDVAAKAYQVRKEVEVDPTNSVTLDVVIKDIWVIPEADLKALSSHTGKMAELLKGSDKAVTGDGLRALITDGLKTVIARQDASVLGVVRPADHIRVYEINLEALERIRKDVGMLENLVVASGKDPESLIGLPRVMPPVETRNSSATGSVLTLHIKITNPSLTEKKKVPLRHDFPTEIKTTDVVDAGGLQIGVDTDKAICYAALEDIELAPGESKVFDVKIRDPWAGLSDLVPRLESRTQHLLTLTKDLDTYKAVDVQARAILKDIEALKARKGPGQVSPDYVAFARRQGEVVRELATRVQRLEELFQPREQPIKFGGPVMDVPRPDKRTTWIIIYIILGFLGAFSALFFLRWYGKGKAEKRE